MSAAGQANEAGSVFRRNAALYFAVYALVGRPVPPLSQSHKILRLDFETSDPTDDIVLDLTCNVKAYVSAKNRVDAGKSFTDTVSGWVAQDKAGMGDDDLLVLAFETSVQWVKDLSEALNRLRVGQDISRSAELKALDKLDNLVPKAQRNSIRRRARLTQIESSSINGDLPTALGLMLSSVINGDSTAALNALSNGLHSLAGAALGADIPAMVEMLSLAGVSISSRGGATPAAIENETKRAVLSYQKVLCERRGRIDLPLLADDLAPVIIEHLYRSLRAIGPTRADKRESPESLDLVVRRHRRLLLVGQPGSGKSVATWEIATACVDDPNAPVPIRVHLPDLLPVLRSRDLNVDDIIRSGIAAMQEPGKQLVYDHLRAAIATGDAMLIFDGLDECRSDGANVAEHLKRIVASLHPEIGVILATRGSAEKSAERLGLVRFELCRPANMNSTMEAVLRECARVRVKDTQREYWLAARRRWLEDVDADQRGLVEVPQLALLVVLIVAESVEMTVPRERAALLHQAVSRSVERWEITRFKAGGLDWAVDLTPLMLLEGFEVLGRKLEEADQLTRNAALDALLELLVDRRWAVPIGRAEELAKQVLRFWDEHVTVFIVDEAGFLSSRSRVFTEIATAMWTTKCDAALLENWAALTLSYDDSEGVLGLAQGLNPSLVEVLLAMGRANLEATLAVADVVVDKTIVIDEHRLQELAEQLVDHISAIDSGQLKVLERRARKADSLGSWIARGRSRTSQQFVRALFGLPLPATVWGVRRSFVFGLPEQSSQRIVLEAWTALIESKWNKRDLTEMEVRSVQAALDIEIPDNEPLIRNSRRSVSIPPSRPTPLGHAPFLILVAENLDRLSEGSPRKVYDASMHISAAEHDSVARALIVAGFDVSQWRETIGIEAMVAALASDQHEVDFLGDIAALQRGASKEVLTKADRWSMKDLADLVYFSGCSSAAIGEFKTAFTADSPETRVSWLECVAAAYGVDIARACAQAEFLLGEPLVEYGRPEDWSLLLIRPSDADRSIEPNSLTREQQEILVAALEAHSSWIAWSAGGLLINMVPQWDVAALYETDWSAWRPRRAVLFPLVAILASADGGQLVRLAAAAADPIYRKAATRAVRVNGSLDPDGVIARNLASDADLSVREDLDSGDVAPTVWSCDCCRAINGIDVVDCPQCDNGTRPILRDYLAK